MPPTVAESQSPGPSTSKNSASASVSEQVEIIDDDDDDEIEFVSTSQKVAPKNTNEEDIPDAVKSLLEYTEQVNDPTLPENQNEGQDQDPETTATDKPNEKSEGPSTEEVQDIKEKAAQDHENFLKSVKKKKNDESSDEEESSSRRRSKKDRRHKSDKKKKRKHKKSSRSRRRYSSSSSSD